VRRRPAPPGPTPLVTHPPDPDRPRLSVVVPAYAEAARIGASVRTLRQALAATAADGGLEIVVVDDGSADDTAGEARRAGADRVIRLDRNRGKGAAVRAGVLAAEGSAVVFTDADLSYPPDQVVRLRDGIERGWDVVAGSRQHIDTRTLVRAGRLREVSGRVFNLVTRAALGLPFGDTQCGLKGFHRDAGRRLFSAGRIDGFAFDVEILWLARHLGLSVTEVPVELDSAAGSTVRIEVDALRMLRDLLRIRRWAASGAYGGLLSSSDPEPPPAKVGAGMSAIDAVFKAYDIRGTVPDQLDAELCRRVGSAFARFTRAERILVARDMRPSGVELAQAFTDGATSTGADVVDLGLASTDLLYYRSTPPGPCSPPPTTRPSTTGSSSACPAPAPSARRAACATSGTTPPWAAARWRPPRAASPAESCSTTTPGTCGPSWAPNGPVAPCG
jgi:dolichyl-phosphate beta-glucosyltransferase